MNPCESINQESIGGSALLDHRKEWLCENSSTDLPLARPKLSSKKKSTDAQMCRSSEGTHSPPPLQSFLALPNSPNTPKTIVTLKDSHQEPRTTGTHSPSAPLATTAHDPGSRNRASALSTHHKDAPTQQQPLPERNPKPVNQPTQLGDTLLIICATSYNSTTRQPSHPIPSLAHV